MDLGIKGAFSKNGTCTLKLSDTDDQWRQIVKKVMKLDSSSQDQTPMVLVIIDSGKSNKRAYSKVKSSFAIEHGFQSSCISTPTVGKAHNKDIDDGLDKYAGALLQKVLAKAPGRRLAHEFAVHGAQHKASQQYDTLFAGYYVTHLPMPEGSKSNGEEPYSRTSAVTIATKFLGEDGPYKTLTQLLSTFGIENGLYDVLKNHIQRLGVEFAKSSSSRILLFRSGKSEPIAPQPIGSTGFKGLEEQEEDAVNPEFDSSPEISVVPLSTSQGSDKQGIGEQKTSQNPIISEEVERFRLYCINDLRNTIGVYITVEKPKKLNFYNEEGVPLTGTENTEIEKRKRVAWVIQSDIGGSADREIFSMKETKGVNRH